MTELTDTWVPRFIVILWKNGVLIFPTSSILARSFDFWCLNIFTTLKRKHLFIFFSSVNIVLYVHTSCFSCTVLEKCLIQMKLSLFNF